MSAIPYHWWQTLKRTHWVDIPGEIETGKHIQNILDKAKPTFKIKQLLKSKEEKTWENLVTKWNEELWCNLQKDMCDEIWKVVFRWIKQNSGTIIQYQPTDTLLGWIDLPSINCIFIIIKQYIYSCRVAGRDPTPMIALTKITSIQNIEKNIAENKDKIKIHNDKWSFLLSWNLFITSCMFIKYLSYSSSWCMHWGKDVVV